jgi:hypothetical protein
MANKPEFADVRFRVTEFADGTPYLSTQENGPDTNTVLNSHTNFIMLLKKGITMNDAEALKEHLNKHVSQISLQFQ